MTTESDAIIRYAHDVIVVKRRTGDEMAMQRKTNGQADTRQEAAARLQAIPNVGPATAGDLLRLGISCPDDLAGRDPDALYQALCALDGQRHDPCVRDVFAAVVAYANGEEARPWWTFTPARKARDNQAISTDRTRRTT
jgi:hypothetical protein